MSPYLITIHTLDQYLSSHGDTLFNSFLSWKSNETPVALENPSLEDVDSVTLQQSAEKPDPSEVYRLLSEKSISYDLNPEENRQKEMDSVNKNVTRVFVMRHGERVDFTFGNWLSYSLDEAGNYVQQDLNLPDQLPKRRDPQVGFI